jgi:ribonuclease BN (tRNA processing enzyme)
MRVHLLGTGTVHPVAGQASAGLAVEAAGQVHGLDLGRGVQNRWAEAGLDPLGLRWLHLTHLHPDHCCDLVPLLFARNYAGPPRPLTITGPEGLTALVAHLGRAWRWVRPRFPLHLREMEESSFQAGDVRVAAAFLDHGGQANLAYRIEAEGRSVVYTGDTGRGEGLLNLAHRAHILISECSFTDDRDGGGHMCPSRLGPLAQAAGVERLVVTHLFPGTDGDEVERVLRRHYDGEILLAADGMVLDL